MEASHIEKIELFKEKDGFGFSIAGGIENQHIPGQNGIFITKIISGGPAYKNGNLIVGSELIAIENFTVSLYLLFTSDLHRV